MGRVARRQSPRRIRRFQMRRRGQAGPRTGRRLPAVALRLRGRLPRRVQQRLAPPRRRRLGKGLAIPVRPDAGYGGASIRDRTDQGDCLE